MDVIKMMEETQPENFMEALFTVDVMKMAPIHRAALFNHFTVIKYLLEHVSYEISLDGGKKIIRIWGQ